MTKANREYSVIAASDEYGYFYIDAPTQWHYMVYPGFPGKWPTPEEYAVYERQICIAGVGYDKKFVILNCGENDVGTIKLQEAIF